MGISTGNNAEASLEVHLSIVRLIAQRLKRSLPAQIQLSDLESAGREGLVGALRSFDPSRGSLETWLRFKVRGAMIDSVRGKVFREACCGRIPEATPGKCASPEQDAIDQEGARRMKMAIGRLTPKQRVVLNLRYAENLSERQTARRARISIEAVKRLRSRAVRDLRTALGSERLTARAIAIALS